jgi:hypothetical protein
VLDGQTIEMIEPRYMPLLGYAEAWSPATNGEVVASAVLLAGKSADEVTAMQAELKGAACSGATRHQLHHDRSRAADGGARGRRGDSTCAAPARGGGRGANTAARGGDTPPARGGDATAAQTGAAAQRLDVRVAAAVAAETIRSMPRFARAVPPC